MLSGRAFWGVKVVANEYALQTFGSRALPSEAYFYWLHFPNFLLTLAVGKHSIVNIGRKTIKQQKTFIYLIPRFFLRYGAG